MHYRTPRIGFLDPVEPFLDTMPAVHRLKETSFDTDELPAQDGPLVVVPSTP
jgi:hypothetical protein